MNAAALALLLLAGRPQEDKGYKEFTISRQQRSSYVPALLRFQEAGLQTDPLERVKRCGELLEDKSIHSDHWDAMIRIMNTDGSYGDWSLLAPYQLRGRAHLARAESLASSDRREAAKVARLALADLEESARRGLKSSEAPLDRARKLALQLKEAEPVPNERLADAERRLGELRKLRDQNAPPERVLEQCEAAAAAVKDTPYEEGWRYLRADAFLAGWTGPMLAERFHSARAAVKALGGFLTDAERKHVLEKIDEHSRASARRFHANLRDLLPDQETWAAFVRAPAAEIGRRLAVPPPQELDDADAGLQWAARCRDRLLRALQTPNLPSAPLDDFLQILSLAAQTCVEAAGQVREGENRAFAALEALVQDLAAGRLGKNLEGAFMAETDGLAGRRNEARRILEVLDSLAAQLEKGAPGAHPIVTKHLGQLRSTVERLPIDPARLDEIGRRLLDPSDPKGLWGRSPLLALEFEAELSEWDKAQGSRLSRSSRRKLGTYQLLSAIARVLLAGGKAEEVAQREELKTLARRLEVDGGPLPEAMKLVSPRIRSVMDLLKS